MGNSVSQSIDRFLSNDVSSTVVQEVIERYASETTAISTNTNVLNIVIGGESTEAITGPIDIKQKITSYINVNQMVDRSNKTELSNDLVQSVTTSINDAIDKVTDGIAGFLQNPSNQSIVSTVKNKMSSYVSQVISVDTVDNLVLSSSNYNNGTLTINAKYISGPINYTQEIQSSIIAQNIVKQVVDNAIKNKEVQDLENDIRGALSAEEKSPLTTIANAASSFLNPRSLILIAALVIGIIVAIIGVVAAVMITVPPKMKMIIGGAGVALGVLIALGGIIYYVASKPKV